MKNPGRPAVRDDVVHSEEEDKVRISEADQGSAEERAFSEIKREIGLVSGDLRGACIAERRRERRKIVNRERDGERRSDDLDRTAVNGGESSSKDFVPPDYLVHAAAQDRRVDLHCKTKRHRGIVKHASRDQLIEKPQSLLRIRHRQWIRGIASTHP